MIVKIGLGFEAWLEKVMATADNNTLVMVNTSDQIDLIT